MSLSHRNHPFYDKHDDRLKALWCMDRSNPNVNEKLAQLKEAVEKHSASGVVDMYDEKTGESRAKVPILIIACFEGDYHTIKFLLDHGADPNECDSDFSLTGIHILVDGPYKVQTITESERAQLIREMIKKGANVNHLDKNQLAPIHKAVINDRPECVDALIEANADPNLLFMGERAISIAVRQNRDQILKKLLNYPRTETDIKTGNGGNLLHFAAAGMMENPACTRILLEAGFNANVQDQRGNTPLMIACFLNRPSIVKALIDAKADPKIKNNDGKDAAALCEERGSEECKVLLQ